MVMDPNLQGTYTAVQSRAPSFLFDDLSMSQGMAPLGMQTVTGSVSRALAAVGRPAPTAKPGQFQRYDSMNGLIAGPDAIRRYNKLVDAELIAGARRLRPDLLTRQDSGLRRHFEEWRDRSYERILQTHTRKDAQGFIQASVGAFARDFEYIRQEVMEEALEPLTAMSLFKIDSSVPLGARTHTVRRRTGAGAARIIRGGSEVPLVNIAFAEQSFGVAYLACGVPQDFFETLTLDFASINAYQEGLRVGRRLVEERLNDLAWFGDEDSNLFGVLTYPDLAKRILPLAYTNANSETAQGAKQLIVQLQDLCNTPRVRSGTRFKPNRLVVSPKLMAFLSSKKHELNGGTDTTMLEFFLRTNTLGITSVDEAPELAGIGPSGEDGIFAYRDSTESIRLCMIQQPTTMPQYQTGVFNHVTAMYAAWGGVIMADVGNNILGYANVQEL